MTTLASFLSAPLFSVPAMQLPLAFFASWWSILLALLALLLGLLMARFLFNRSSRLNVARNRQTLLNRKLAGIRGYRTDNLQCWDLGTAAKGAAAAAGAAAVAGTAAAGLATSDDTKEEYDWGIGRGTSRPTNAADFEAGASGEATAKVETPAPAVALPEPELPEVQAEVSVTESSPKPTDDSGLIVRPDTADALFHAEASTEPAAPEASGDLADSPDRGVSLSVEEDLDAEHAPSGAQGLGLAAAAIGAGTAGVAGAAGLGSDALEEEAEPFTTTARSAESYDALMRAEFADENVRADEHLGILYNGIGKVDNLQLIKGVGPGLEDKLNESGVYRFKQLAAWDKHNVEAFSRKLGTFPDRVEQDKWVPQARSLADLASAEERESYLAPLSVDHNAKLLSDFGGENVRIDGDLGIVYNVEPDLRDDLQAIDGVGPKMEEQLNEFGVYRYKQLAAWSDRNVDVFSERLDTFKDRIERDKWIPQARRQHAERFRISGWDTTNPSDLEYEELINVAYAGEDVSIRKRIGVVYNERPANTDDLTALPGVDARMAKKLNGLGIYRALQISHWSEDAVSDLSQRLGVPKDLLYAWADQASLGLPGEGYRNSNLDALTEVPETPAVAPPPAASAQQPSRDYSARADAYQATAAKFAGEDVTVDAKLGVLYSSRPATVDDLTAIKGVGQVINDKLHNHGVYRWKQIALWTREQADDFAEELATFQNRIHRDEWIAEAAELHREQYGESL